MPVDLSEDLLEGRRKVGLAVFARKTKYMVVSHHQNIEQNHNMDY
jgi:hypothetical protein